MNATTTFTSRKSSPKIVTAVLKSVLLAVPIGMMVLLLFSFLALQFPDPAPMATPFGYIAMILTAMFCGILAAKMGKGSFLLGLLSGGILAFLLFILSLIFQTESSLPFPLSVLFYPAVALISGLGGIIGKKRSPKRRRIRR